jgi:Apc15p protein
VFSHSFGLGYLHLAHLQAQAHSLWYTPVNGYFVSSGSDPQAQDTPNSLSQNSNHYQSVHGSRRGNNRNNYLTQLQLDEEFVVQRKLNIQRFGAAWIRPPGVPKTYQMVMDEQAEREEAEAQAAREAQMMQGVEEAEFDAVEEEDEGAEQDLDDQIPEAEDLVGDDEEELAEEDEGMDEQDLDDDVPEAGSYQHTDTEQSDDDEDDDDTQDLELSIDASQMAHDIHHSSIVRSDGAIEGGSPSLPRIDAIQRRRYGSDRMDVDRREN